MWSDKKQFTNIQVLGFLLEFAKIYKSPTAEQQQLIKLLEDFLKEEKK